MELEYREGWPAAQERLRAFWAGDAIDRPALGITAPRETSLPGPAAPETPEDLSRRWLDAGFRIAQLDHHMRHTHYAGEAAPNAWANLGPGFMATYFGSPPVFMPETVWFHETDFDYGPLFLDADGQWQTVARRMTEAFVEAFAGKALIGMCDIGGGSDILASLRGTEQLLMDCLDRPSDVARTLLELAAHWGPVFDDLYRATEAVNEGGTQWLSVWAPGPMYNIQSDFCFMVSPAVFDDLIAPERDAVCRHLEYSLYNLDGPGEIKHLDRLLAIDELGGIQWTPHCGEGMSERIPMYRKIQAAGKLLHLHGAAAEVEKVCRALKPEGLMVQATAASEDEARDTIRQAPTWSAGPRWE